MNVTAGEGAGRRIAARRDIVLIVAVAVVAAWVCAKFNLSEALLNWTRPFERLQLDELPAVLLVIAISLIWFSSRRYFEAKRQLLLRRTAEAQLERALAENQRLAQQYVDTQENERKALARDLHDELGQYLNAIKLDAVSIRESMAVPPGVRDVSRAMIANIDRVYDVVTGLIRQLRPVGFDDLGFAAAVEHCVDDWRSRLPQTAIELSVSGDFASLDESRGLVLFRLVQEALTNIARHARAARVEIRIDAGRSANAARCVEILIADNGIGADLRAPRLGLGLVGMRERVSALGGSISLASERGAGFRVKATVPMAGVSS
ncbi:MAG TPA: ATP-binding protein [Steroidobacteraceae bacterium]|jgi:glucose-6-phosphate-specific signal transduction histidine kinase